jgi:hypothetical protein
MKHAYVLERSTRELDRLDLQGLIYRDATRRALMSCGIEEGMRVLVCWPVVSAWCRKET